MRGIVRAAAYAVATVIALIVALDVVLPWALSTDIPLAVVSSYSMEPTLHVGDLLIVVGVRGEDVKVGDVIVYRGRREPIVHRVIRVAIVNGSPRFLTKGDANRCPDQNPSDPSTWVSEDRLVGKVVAVVPYLGAISLSLSRSRELYYAVLLGLIALLVISALPRRRRVFK